MLSSTQSRSACLSIVVPVYNEEATLQTVVQKLVDVPYLHEIIIVDDCSTDCTSQIAASLARIYAPTIRVMRHSRNAGKTEALKTGFEATTGNIVLVQDADLEYDPAEIAHLIDPVVNGLADVVFGSRFRIRRAARVFYFYHYVANQFITFMSNLFTNLNLTDVETGYKAFRGEIIRNMTITSSGFGFEIEVTAKIAKLKCAVYEVPISYYGRTYEEGKKIGTKDGVAALWYLVKYNLLTGIHSSFKPIPVLSPCRIAPNLSEGAAEIPGVLIEKQSL